MTQVSTGKNETYLVTGASGYIGGRVIPLLLEQGVKVRILARHPERLRQREWFDDVEIVAGDAESSDDLHAAMRDVAVAYYLLHSLGSGTGFEDVETNMARLFGTVAKREGVGRIVYLGGMIPPGDPELSPHLRSRKAVGEILRASGVPTIELRAAVIIGAGSASFEMLRYLTERLPVMVTPRWVKTRTQPIAVRDVLHYLVGAATIPSTVNRAFDIGGPDVLTYAGMMNGFAKVAGLRPRVIMPVNVLTPGLSSRWVGLVTPVPRGIARPLVESLRVEVVCQDHDIAQYVPDPEPGLIGYSDAVERALRRIGEAKVSTRWSGASVPGVAAEPMPTDPDWTGGSLYSDDRTLDTPATPEQVWRVIEGIGGENGYYAATWMWEVRGAMDRLIGGVGLRRGRRDRFQARVGDAIDFWRVEERLQPTLFRLRAEMRMPGLAWLEWSIEATATGSLVRQRAIFYPRGLAGHAYWWMVFPFHIFVFQPMIRGIAHEAQIEAETSAEPASPISVQPAGTISA